MNRLAWRCFRVVFDALDRSFRIASRVPGSSRVADAILDTILGPAEDFEYVSTTAPSSPPPTP